MMRPFYRVTMSNLIRALCAGLLAVTTVAAEPAGGAPDLQQQWQTFESCPRAERPCGPVCMPESFSCCEKALGTICPPGKSCCGTRCGCGKCEKCESGVCVADKKCLKEQEGQQARLPSQGSPEIDAGAVVPATILGLGIIGATLDTGSDSRRPPSP